MLEAWFCPCSQHSAGGGEGGREGKGTGQVREEGAVKVGKAGVQRDKRDGKMMKEKTLFRQAPLVCRDTDKATVVQRRAHKHTASVSSAASYASTHVSTHTQSHTVPHLLCAAPPSVPATRGQCWSAQTAPPLTCRPQMPEGGGQHDTARHAADQGKTHCEDHHHHPCPHQHLCMHTCSNTHPHLLQVDTCFSNILTPL